MLETKLKNTPAPEQIQPAEAVWACSKGTTVFEPIKLIKTNEHGTTSILII